MRSIPFMVLATLVVGCGDSTGPTPEPITELPRSLTASEIEVIDASNRFGFELLSAVLARDDRANVVLSPLSASMALGMTLNGAGGSTFDAMRSTLGFGSMALEDIDASYASLIALLRDLDEEVTFTIGNSIWAREGFPFHDAFFEAVEEAFDARIENRDFSDPATVDAINDWVDEATGGRIPRIVDGLDPALVMLLINAIYFDGRWTEAFDPSDTRAADFHRADGTVVSVDLMSRSEATVPVAFDEDWAAVELPYGGGAFAMVVLVPTGERTAREIARELDAERWNQVVGGLAEQELARVAIPRFTTEYDAILNAALEAMGMEVAFGPEADFTAMSPAGEQLCIDYVRQKTFLEVDEAGTRAAAVTSVGIGVTSLPPSVVADRPFLFALRERLSGTVLFTGVIGDPTVADSGPGEGAGRCS